MDGIVVGVNGSEESDEALDWAATEARRRDLPLAVVHVAPEGDDAALSPVLEQRRAELAQIVDRAAGRLGASDALEADRLVVPGPAADALLTASAGARMLVLGRRRRNRLGRRILGSVSTTVAENAEIPVTVVRRAHDGDPTDGAPDTAMPGSASAPPDGLPADRPRIVVGVDTSPPSIAALRHAIEVASATDAVLEPVFAWQITTLAPLPGSWGWAPPIDDYENFARECLHEAVAQANVMLDPASGDADGPTGTPGATIADDRVFAHVVHGQAARVLIDRAAGADRVVVGTRGLGGFDRLVLGSTSRQVLDHAGCPVTVVRS